MQSFSVSALLNKCMIWKFTIFHLFFFHGTRHIDPLLANNTHKHQSNWKAIWLLSFSGHISLEEYYTLYQRTYSFPKHTSWRWNTFHVKYVLSDFFLSFQTKSCSISEVQCLLWCNTKRKGWSLRAVWSSLFRSLMKIILAYILILSYSGLTYILNWFCNLLGALLLPLTLD